MNGVYVGGDRVLCQTAHGMTMFVDGRDISLAPHLIRGAEWEAHMTRLLAQLLDPGMTFVDVGANFGWFTLAAARSVGPTGRVIAVEANPETFDLLASNVEINGFADRTTLWRKAAWHEAADLDFHVMRKHKGTSSLRRDVAAWTCAQHDSMECIRVEADRLDALVGDGPVHFVKIDAEGSEPHVLRGMRGIMAKNPDLCVSMEFAPAWYPDGGADGLLDELEGYGFQIRKIGPESQLIEMSRAELLTLPHHDLLLIPGDMVL